MLGLTLVRHCRTALNVRGAYQGRTDAGLTSGGERRARRIGRFLRDGWTEGDVATAPPPVWTSTRARSRRTAALAFPDAAPRPDPRLDELDFGAFEGATHDENLERHGNAYLEWIEDPAGRRPPGGESLAELRDRVRSWMDDLPADGRAVAVTHGGPIGIVLASVLGIPFPTARRLRPAPGDWIRVRVDPDAPWIPGGPA